MSELFGRSHFFHFWSFYFVIFIYIKILLDIIHSFTCDFYYHFCFWFPLTTVENVMQLDFLPGCCRWGIIVVADSILFISPTPHAKNKAKAKHISSIIFRFISTVQFWKFILPNNLERLFHKNASKNKFETTNQQNFS